MLPRLGELTAKGWVYLVVMYSASASSGKKPANIKSEINNKEEGMKLVEII